MEQTKMENLNFTSNNTLSKSLQHDSSIQNDSDILAFSDTQFLRVSRSLSPELPTTPQPSPVWSAESIDASQVDNQFTSDLMKACTSTFCDNTEPWENTTEDLITALPSASFINLRLQESSPKESACTTFCDNAKQGENTTEDMTTVLPSKSSSNLRLQLVEPSPKKTSQTTFCGNLKPLEDSAKDMAIVSSFPSCQNLRLLESNPTESACSPFCDSSRFHECSAADMATAPPSTSNKIQRQSQRRCIASEWDTENGSAFCEIKCSFPAGLGSSMSDISLNTSSSDIESILAHRASDVSDLSMTEYENLNSNWDITFPKLEGRKIIDMEFPIDCCQINSPKKPMSSVRQFLSRRKNKMRRKTVSSVGNIYTPEIKSEDKESIFLLTI